MRFWYEAAPEGANSREVDSQREFLVKKEATNGLPLRWYDLKCLGVEKKVFCRRVYQVLNTLNADDLRQTADRASNKLYNLCW